jgi:hypothetical protein
MPDFTDNEYTLGDPVGIENTFDPAPPSATAEVRKPNGTIIAPTLTDAGGGRFTGVVPATDQVGLWWYSIMASTGAVDTGSFYVAPRRSASGTSSDLLGDNALVTLSELREFVKGTVLDSSADDKLEFRANEYTAAIMTYTNREWMPLTTGQARTFWYDGRGYLSLAPYDARTITSIVMYTNFPTASQVTLVNGSSTVQAEWYGHVNPRLNTYQWLELPITNVRCQVTVTGNWGIGTIPEDVKLALKIAVRNAVENPTGYQTSSYGEFNFAEAGPIEAAGRSGGNLPPEARALLAPYKRSGSKLAA